MINNLSDDNLLIILEEFQDDKNKLFSWISVNKNWCKIIISILWKNPWKSLKKKSDKLLLNVIISHFSDETKSNLKNEHELDFLTDSYRNPSFDYISFCRHLNFNKIERMIKSFHEKSKLSIIEKEIVNLFINGNRKYTHLYISYKFNYQLHLIPGFERCISEIHYLNCSTSIRDDLSAGLTELCKSIKVLDLFIESRDKNNYGIIDLIKAQEDLTKIGLTIHSYDDVLYCMNLEGSLIEHANTVRCFKLTKRSTTKIISSFVHLRELEVNGCYNDISEWNCLGGISLPFLQILGVNKIPSNVLICLIESTNESLTEIRTDNIFYILTDEKRVIQAIYQKCPELQYLKLMLTSNNISELERLLIKCHYLNGLFITNDIGFNWDKLFCVLARSSPIHLFKFKFSNATTNYTVKEKPVPAAPNLESLKLFFDKWKDRHPMLLQFGNIENVESLIEEYKAKGLDKKYNNIVSYGKGFDGFEWI